MNANANIVKLEKGTSDLVRPRFSPGLLLRDDDLRTGVEYTRELSRLLFRSLFGCGVVCGLKVEVGIECGKLVVTINPGVALNSAGDPIHVKDPVKISIDPTCGDKIQDPMWVILCRTEKCCAPRSAVCGCEEEDSTAVCTREREGFEIRLVKEEPKTCVCMCEEQKFADGDTSEASDCWCADPCSNCYKDHYAGLCDCDCCEPDCVMLAVLRQSDEEDANGEKKWVPNHSVRRFVRPVLMRDPVVFGERNPDFDPCKLDTAQSANAVKGDVAEKKMYGAALEKKPAEAKVVAKKMTAAEMKGVETAAEKKAFEVKAAAAEQEVLKVSARGQPRVKASRTPTAKG